MDGLNGKFKFFCAGTVAEDISIGSMNIRLFPHEHINDFDGDIESTEDVSKQVKTTNNETFNISLTDTYTMTASWLNPNSNRATPPNVRKGEKVLVYTYADTGKYYWTTYGLELDLRGLEHVEYVYSNNPEMSEVTDDNSYKVVHSTLNKHMGFRTADNDGEATTYEKMLDTKEGIDTLVLDGFGNEIKLTSKDGILTITTNSKVIINTEDTEVNCTNATISASDKTTIKTGTMTVISDKMDINP